MIFSCSEPVLHLALGGGGVKMIGARPLRPRYRPNSRPSELISTPAFAINHLPRTRLRGFGLPHGYEPKQSRTLWGLVAESVSR